MKRGNAKRWNKKLEKLKRGNKENGNEKGKDVKYEWGKMKKRGNWKNEREEWMIVIPEHNAHCPFYSSDSHS